MEGGIERGILDVEGVGAGGLEPGGDVVAVPRAAGQRLEDQRVEGAVEEAFGYAASSLPHELRV